MSNSCNPMDCSPPGSSVHGLSQARILEWVAIPFSKDLPNPGINSGLPHCRQILYHLSHQENPNIYYESLRRHDSTNQPWLQLLRFWGALGLQGFENRVSMFLLPQVRVKDREPSVGLLFYILCFMSNSLWLHGQALCPWNFPARILEWIAISYSKESSQPRDQTHVFWVSCTGWWILYYHCAFREACFLSYLFTTPPPKSIIKPDYSIALGTLKICRLRMFFEFLYLKDSLIIKEILLG